jgi:VanZ family protein
MPMPQRRLTFQKILPVLFWVALAYALVMALLPKPPHFPGNPSDKLQHIFAFTVLSGLAGAAYRRTSLWKIGSGLALFGALIELLQSIPVLHRDASIWDWAADCGAIILVLLIFRFVRQRS